MVREIMLPCGNVALVDDEDYPVVSRFAWYLNGKRRKYVVARNGRNGSVFLHSLVMGGRLTDHIDNDPLNCQKWNLRRCTSQQNSWNVPKYTRRGGRTMTSQYKGVCLDKQTGKWIAGIGFNRRKYDLGRHDCEHEAALAYNAKAVELFGEFAWLNPVSPGSCECAPTPRKPTSSRFRGVFWDERCSVWRAVVTAKRKKHPAGRFKDECEAARAYNLKARELHGDRAYQNDLNPS
jgi:hypothetical protein